VQAGDTGVQTPIDLDCQCSDADPREETTQVNIRCLGRGRVGGAGSALHASRAAGGFSISGIVSSASRQVHRGQVGVL